MLLATTVGRAPIVVPLLGALAMAGVEPLLNGGVSAIAGRGAWSTRVFAWDSLAYNVAGLGGPAVVTVVAIVASPAWALVALGLGAGAIAVTSLGLTVADAPAARAARAGPAHDRRRRPADGRRRRAAQRDASRRRWGSPPSAACRSRSSPPRRRPGDGPPMPASR